MNKPSIAGKLAGNKAVMPRVAEDSARAPSDSNRDQEKKPELQEPFSLTTLVTTTGALIFIAVVGIWIRRKRSNG